MRNKYSKIRLPIIPNIEINIRNSKTKLVHPADVPLNPMKYPQRIKIPEIVDSKKTVKLVIEINLISLVPNNNIPSKASIYFCTKLKLLTPFFRSIRSYRKISNSG